MEDTNVSDALNTRLSILLAEARNADPVAQSQQNPSRLSLLLAARFEYDVRKGGFAQLIYNMNGNCLGAIEDMLIRSNASVAHAHYVQAIHVCLSDKAEYQRFLVSGYTEPNGIKDALHEVSVDYFSKEQPFALEAKSFLLSNKESV